MWDKHRKRTSGTGPLEQNIWNRTSGTGNLGQEIWDRTIGTEQPRHRGWTGRVGVTGHPRQKRKERMARIGQKG
jgi:hypothetical protein